MLLKKKVIHDIRGCGDTGGERREGGRRCRMREFALTER